MGLFGFGKKKEEVAQQTAAPGGCGVKILGGGCDKCNQLEAAAVAALEELGMDTAVDHVTDFSVIASYGVMSTPALVVDGVVVSSGMVLTKAQAMEQIRKVRK